MPSRGLAARERDRCGSPSRGRPVDRAGRRGSRSPSSRATLSNASPAASSTVAPSELDLLVRQVADAQQRRVAAGDQQRDARLGQRPVLEGVDGDVRGQVVDAVERHAEAERVRLRRGDPDQQRAGQARARRSRRPRRSRRAGSRPSPGARCTVGTIASRCARAATSGTTPPKRACSSTRGGERVGEQLAVADDADAGLVARRLDAEDGGHRASPAQRARAESAPT